MTNLEANRIARALGRKGYDSEIKDLDCFGLDKAVRVSADLQKGTPALACWSEYAKASVGAAAMPTIN